MNSYRPLDKEQVRALEQDTRIEHVWSSNVIKGSTLNKYETASILNKGMTVHGESVKDVLAAIDLNEAYDGSCFKKTTAESKHNQRPEPLVYC